MHMYMHVYMEHPSISGNTNNISVFKRFLNFMLSLTHQVGFPKDQLYRSLGGCVGDSGAGLVENVEGKRLNGLFTDLLVGAVGKGMDQRENGILEEWEREREREREREKV